MMYIEVDFKNIYVMKNYTKYSKYTTSNDIVQFWKGKKSSLGSNLSENKIYFVTDIGEIYIGNTLVSNLSSSPSLWRPLISTSGELSWILDKNELPPETTNIKGKTWRPSISPNGDLSWTQNSSDAIPQTMNIKGPQGPQGANGETWKPTGGNITINPDNTVTINGFLPLSGGTVSGNFAVNTPQSSFKVTDNVYTNTNYRINNISAGDTSEAWLNASSLAFYKNDEVNNVGLKIATTANQIVFNGAMHSASGVNNPEMLFLPPQGGYNARMKLANNGKLYLFGDSEVWYKGNSNNTTTDWTANNLTCANNFKVGGQIEFISAGNDWTDVYFKNADLYIGTDSRSDNPGILLNRKNGYANLVLTDWLSGNLKIQSNAIHIEDGSGNNCIDFALKANNNYITYSNFFRFYGKESNDIDLVHNSDSTITINPLHPSSSIRQALRFNWYNTSWEIGNIRGGSSESLGFGVVYNKNKLCFRVSDTNCYVGNNTIYHTGNFNPNNKVDLADTETDSNTNKWISFNNNVGGISGKMGVNDFWRICGRADEVNSGYLELATCDDASEPIYVRQYSGVYTSLVRTLTLLSETGDTIIPGQFIFKVAGLTPGIIKSESNILRLSNIDNINIELYNNQILFNTSDARFSGNVLINGGITQASSIKLKKNVKEFSESALNILNNIDIVEFKYKNNDIEKHIGFIAEDTDSICSSSEKNKMDIGNCIGILIKGIQELNRKVDEFINI